MSGFVILLSTVITLIAMSAGFAYIARGDFHSYWCLAAILAGILALIAGAFLIGITVQERINRSECSSFAEQTDRETWFVHLSYTSWHCMVRTENGWVSIDRLLGVEESER